MKISSFEIQGRKTGLVFSLSQSNCIISWERFANFLRQKIEGLSRIPFLKIQGLLLHMISLPYKTSLQVKSFGHSYCTLSLKIYHTLRPNFKNAQLPNLIRIDIWPTINGSDIKFSFLSRTKTSESFVCLVVVRMLSCPWQVTQAGNSCQLFVEDHILRKSRLHTNEI